MKIFINLYITILIVFINTLCGYKVNAQSYDPAIYIGENSTTHILFKSDLTYVDISNPEVVIAKIVSSSKNMLALKARKNFNFVTTISALEANGTMRTFKVKYSSFPEKLIIDTRINLDTLKDENIKKTTIDSILNNSKNNSIDKNNIKDTKKHGKLLKRNKSFNNSETVMGVDISTKESSNFGRKDAPSIKDITKLKKHIYHIGDRNFNISIYCKNIYVYSDIIYIVLDIYNNTNIGYDAGDAQFTIESLRQTSDNLVTDKPIWAKSSYGSLSCPPKSHSIVGFTLPKTTLLKNECLRIYIYEKSGKRNLILTFTDKDINYAQSPK